MSAITIQQFRQMQDRVNGKAKVKRSKYGNIKTVVDGIKFDSKKEAGRYQELKGNYIH